MNHTTSPVNVPSAATSVPDITTAYEDIAGLEERMAEMQGALRAKICALKAQLARLERDHDNLDAMGRQAVALLQDEALIKKMMASKGKKMSQLAEFIQKSEAMLQKLSMEAGGDDMAKQKREEEQEEREWSDGGSFVAQTELSDPFI
ncbi:hypothetical protein IWZ00DRAFT_484230 [Phyllosticta capitalensis]